MAAHKGPRTAAPSKGNQIRVAARERGYAALGENGKRTMRYRLAAEFDTTTAYVKAAIQRSKARIGEYKFIRNMAEELGYYRADTPRLVRRDIKRRIIKEFDSPAVNVYQALSRPQPTPGNPDLIPIEALHMARLALTGDKRSLERLARRVIQRVLNKSKPASNIFALARQVEALLPPTSELDILSGSIGQGSATPESPSAAPSSLE